MDPRDGRRKGQGQRAHHGRTQHDARSGRAQSDQRAHAQQHQPETMQSIAPSQSGVEQYPPHEYGYTYNSQTSIHQPIGYDRNTPRLPQVGYYQQRVTDIVYNVPPTTQGYQYSMYAPVEQGSSTTQAPAPATAYVQPSFYSLGTDLGSQAPGINILPQGDDQQHSQFYAPSQHTYGGFQLTHPSSVSDNAAPSTQGPPAGSTTSSPPTLTVESREVLFATYEKLHRQTVRALQENRLPDAAEGLLRLSQELLGSVGRLKDLGRDDASQKEFRYKLWRDFNNIWRAVLLKQEDVSEAHLAAKRDSVPNSILSVERIPGETLERLGNELMALCDDVDEWGLVDYEMGVWEEQIDDQLLHCRKLAKELDGKGQSPKVRSPVQVTATTPAPSVSGATSRGERKRDR